MTKTAPVASGKKNDKYHARRTRVSAQGPRAPARAVRGRICAHETRTTQALCDAADLEPGLRAVKKSRGISDPQSMRIREARADKLPIRRGVQAHGSLKPPSHRPVRARTGSVINGILNDYKQKTGFLAFPAAQFFSTKITPPIPYRITDYPTGLSTPSDHSISCLKQKRPQHLGQKLDTSLRRGYQGH
jgi:hypothetical protein